MLAMQACWISIFSANSPQYCGQANFPKYKNSALDTSVLLFICLKVNEGMFVSVVVRNKALSHFK